MSNEKNQLPETKDAYSFSESTRELLGVVTVHLSPIEGEYFLPANVVIAAPSGTLGPRQAFRLNTAGDAWEVVDDFRRVMLYNTETGRIVPNTLALGDALPAGITADPPPIHSDQEPIRVVWDSQARAWREEPDYSRFSVYEKASGKPAPRLAAGDALPDTLTLSTPPPQGEHVAPQWDEASASWALVADYRGVTYWLADGSEHAIEALGVTPPENALNYKPAEVDSPAE